MPAGLELGDEPAVCLDHLRPGDTVLTDSLDWPSCFLVRLIEIVGTLHRLDVGFKKPQGRTRPPAVLRWAAGLSTSSRAGGVHPQTDLLRRGKLWCPEVLISACYLWARHPAISSRSVHHVQAVSSRLTPCPPSRCRGAPNRIAATCFATRLKRQRPSPGRKRALTCGN